MSDYYDDDIVWPDVLPYSLNTDAFRKKHGIPDTVPENMFTHGSMYNGLSIFNPVVKTDGYGGDAGIDFFCAEHFTLIPHTSKVIDSFVVIYMLPGEVGLLRPRGGDKFVVLSGVIDASYTGSVKFRILNPYNSPMEFGPGDPIGQMVLVDQARMYGKNLAIRNHNEMQEQSRQFWEEQRQLRGSDGRINNDDWRYSF